MAEQSPDTSAIVDAFNEQYELVGPFDDWVEVCLAAALEALADRVVPADDYYGNCDTIRKMILDIVAELKANQ